MKVRIVCYEDPETWICGKIARRLSESLNQMGHPCEIAAAPDDTADINHHVIYLNYPGSTIGVHTLMVTHIDDALKLRKLERALESARMAVCMSSPSVTRLRELGVSADKLSYVNPAHDGKAQPRRLVTGITTRLYPDGRKREDEFVKLTTLISPNDFSFRIMGFGWASIVEDMKSRGFIVEYTECFDYDRYIELMSGLDYFLYLGDDEGSMGFVDALAAGVKTIVQPQGFHLDAPGGISHLFRDFPELVRVFETIAEEKHRLQQAVSKWTWDEYALQHVSIWKGCLSGNNESPGAAAVPVPVSSRFRLRYKLWLSAFSNRARMVMNIGRDFDCESRLWQKRHQKSHGKKRDLFRR